jgi:hypothetical protein
VEYWGLKRGVTCLIGSSTGLSSISSSEDLEMAYAKMRDGKKGMAERMEGRGRILDFAKRCED